MKIRWYHFFSLMFPLQLSGLLYLLLLRRFLPSPPFWEWMLFCLGGAVLSLIARQRNYDPDRSRVAALLRYLILWSGTLYLYHKLFREDFLKPDFTTLPPELILLFAGSLFAWSTASRSFEPFLFRQHFHGLLFRHGKVRIKEKIRNLGYYLNRTLSGQRVLLRRIWAALWLPAVLLWLVHLNRSQPYPDEILFMTVQIILLLFWRMKISQSLEEDILLGEDVVLDSRSRRGEGRTLFLLSTLLFPLSWLLAGPKQIFSGQWILDLLSWFGSLFKVDESITIQALDRVEETMPAQSSPPPFSGLDLPEGREPFRLPEEWKRALLIAAGVLVAAAFVFYLVYPLWKNRGNYRQDKGGLNWLQRWLRTIRDWLRQWKEDRSSYKALRVDWDRKDSTDPLQRQPSSLEERKIRNRLVRLFRKLIRWGEKRGLPYHRGMGPEAYIRYLGEAFPDQREDFEEKALVLRRIFYSSRIPDPEEIPLFGDWIKKIQRLKPGNKTARSKR